MSALNAVRSILSADSTVFDEVADRIYFVEFPQSESLPGIVLHSDSNSDETHLGGSNQFPVFRFVVDCLGNNYGEANDLGESVIDALRDYSGAVTGFDVIYVFLNDLDIFDSGETGQVVRRRIGFRMRYRTSY